MKKRVLLGLTLALGLTGCGGTPSASQEEQEAMLQTLILIEDAHSKFRADVDKQTGNPFVRFKRETPPFVARAKRTLQSPTPEDFQRQFKEYVAALEASEEYFDNLGYDSDPETALEGYLKVAARVGEEKDALIELMKKYVIQTPK